MANINLLLLMEGLISKRVLDGSMFFKDNFESHYETMENPLYSRWKPVIILTVQQVKRRSSSGFWSSQLHVQMVRCVKVSALATSVLRIRCSQHGR